MGYYDNKRYLLTGGKRPLVFTVDTPKAGSASNTIVVPFEIGSSLDYKISWGDGSSDNETTGGNKTHVYSSPGIYTIKVFGKTTNLVWSSSGDALKIIEFKQFGDVLLRNNHTFANCSNCYFTYTDAPKFWNNPTNAQSMFRNTKFIDSDLSWLNSTGTVTTFFASFSSIPNNINSPSLLTLNLSNAINCAMFRGSQINQNLGNVQLFASNCNAGGMFENTSMSTANYTDTLVGWANQIFNNGAPINVNFSSQLGRTFDTSRSGGDNFANAGAARTYLTGTVGWTISGDTVI